MMSNMLQRANNTECVFVFSVMSNVLQRQTRQSVSLYFQWCLMCCKGWTRQSMACCLACSQEHPQSYCIGLHHTVCVFSVMWKACCSMQTTQSPGIRRVHKEHRQSYHTLCIFSEHAVSGKQHRVFLGIRCVHKEHRQSYHALCIFSDVNTGRQHRVWPGIGPVSYTHLTLPTIRSV